MAPTRDQLLTTAEKFFTSWDEENPESVIALRAANCRHVIRPSSVGMTTDGFTNEQYFEYAKPFLDTMRYFEVVPVSGGRDKAVGEKMVDVETRTVVLHCLARAETKKTGLKFESEYVFMITMDESGEKIERVVEFGDSKNYWDWMGRYIDSESTG